MKLHFLCTLFFFLLFFNTLSFTYSNLHIASTNHQTSTFYTFSFTPLHSLTSVEVVITFPIEYSLSQFASSLICLQSQSGINDQYSEANCWIEPQNSADSLYLVGSVVVEIGTLSNTSPTYITLKNIMNPSTSSTGYFRVCLRKGGVLIECNKAFGRVILSPMGIESSSTQNILTDPEPYVGQGITYIFSMGLSNQTLAYKNEKLKIRVHFPDDFNSDDPICSISKIYEGQQLSYTQAQSQILPGTPSQVQCLNITSISEYLGDDNLLKIKVENMINPLNAATYADFKIEIIESLYSKTIQVISFPSVSLITQALTASIEQENMMRISTNLYYFTLNNQIDLEDGSMIVVNFTEGNWNFHSVHPIIGFTSPQTFTYSTSGNILYLQNYGLASNQQQQIFSVNLTSPYSSGTYNVLIETRIQNNLVGNWSGDVIINQTYGKLDLLSISTVQSPVKLPVNETGPLQLTFFLNYELPPSDDVPNGTLEISIYPQIPEPDPEINGVVKCYWKGTLQAASCTYNNQDPTKTVITLVSPPHDAYKYSEIPLIITTEGGNSTTELGLTIDPVVQRYRFQCEFHLYNSSVTPSQVFYSTWIADAIQMENCSAISFTHQCDEETHLQVKIISPVLELSTPKQFRILIQFLNADGSGWAESVGYQDQSLYQRYPCFVKGPTGDNIFCDLYTYDGNLSSYSNLHINNDLSGPFIIVYGFEQNLVEGTEILIQLPKIKIGSTPGSEAMLGISFLQQTPGQKQPFVEIYYQNFVVFTTISSVSSSYTTLNSSQISPIQVQSLPQYNIEWTTNDSIMYIKYEFSLDYFPSLMNEEGVCNGSDCKSLAYPANWIVEYPANISANFSMNTVVGAIQSMDYLTDKDVAIPVKIYTYDENGNTLHKYQMDFIHTAKTIPSAAFTFQETIVYGGLQQQYSITFTNTNTTLSSYPFLRFILNGSLNFVDPAQCSSSTLIAFNESDIKCERQDAQTMKVYNIESLSALGSYSIEFKMETNQIFYNTTISPSVDIQINHNYSVDNSMVSISQDVILSSTPIPLMSPPALFQIHNPQIVNENIQIGYIGPLYVQFQSTSSGTYNINLTLSDHRYNGGGWRTPNSDDLDPVVCLLNEVRFYCSPTNGPLQIIIENAEIISGTNELRIDTEYIDPYNGIKYPDVAGFYSITLTTDDGSTQKSVSFVTEIYPPKFLHMQASSIVKDINTQSVYILNFTLPSWHIYPNSNIDPANYSRILIEFPTFMGTEEIFSQNLGGYNGEINERVGCSFTPGSPYIAAEFNTTLQCRLRPSLHEKQPTRIEIRNHAAFTSSLNTVSVYIFKVMNPAQSFSSVDITAKIEHVEVGTGYIYPLFEQTYRMFMDPRSQNTAPTTYPSADDGTVQLFQAGLDVGDYGYLILNSHTVSANPINQPFYTLFKLPPYLTPEDSQVSTAFSSCPSGAFEFCVSVPQINYILVKGSFNTSYFQPYIKDYPISISQNDSFFYSYVFEEGRFTGIVQHTISAQYRWKEIQGLITLNYCEATGSQSKIVKQKEKFELAISFTTTNYIPATGSIQIGLPSSVTNVQPHCRSTASNTSLLYAQAGLTGQIGCQVQNVNKWVITGFSEVAGGTTIIIKGVVDLPSVTGTIGTGHITTYADNDLLDIHTNGSRIDHLQADFGLSLVDTFAMNVNEQVFMSQRTVIRAGYVGQYRQLLQSASTITNSDTISLRFSINDIKGNAGGFALTLTKKVCQFLQMDTNQQVGCKVISETSDTSTSNHEAIVYQLQPTSSLLSNTKYEIRLTTQEYSLPTTPEGISYPATPGTYKIQTVVDISGTVQIEQSYIEIYGTEFTSLKVTQYNYIAEQYNLIWVEFQPTTTITTSHQIILEFPTLSSDLNSPCFDDNLGLNQYSDGEIVPVDVFDSAPLDNTFMNCRIYHGDQTKGSPAKLVCGNLISSLTPGNTLKFAFGFVNPPKITPSVTPSQISLPLIVYSFDPFYFQKTNFNLVNGALMITNEENILAPNGYFNPASYQYQMPNEDLTFGDAHTDDILDGDAYILRFNFPIRVNGLQTGACKSADGLTVYGDAYYHENLRAIVCKIIGTTIPAQTAPLTQTMMVSSFYTPWYRLTDVERYVHAIATYHSTSTSEVINYFDLFPHLSPKYDFATSSTIQITPHIGHNIACQADDYVFTVRLEDPASADDDLQYTKMIGIELPLTTVVDYNPLNTDCVEDPSSEIQVILCEIDIAARFIFVEIVPGVYTNGKVIAIKTKDLAIRNPCTFWASATITEFTVYYFSWENVTALSSRSTDYAYMTINSSNVNAFPLTYTQEQYPTSVFSNYFTFDWIHTPHERYFEQFPQYDSDQYSPFSFDIWLTTALSTLPVGSYHTLTLYYGTDYVERTVQSTLDLQYDKPVCYLNNNRVARCFLDTVNNKIYMEFSFAVSSGKPIHVYFSILDPRQPDRNGFRYIGASDFNSVQVDLTPFGQTTLVFQTQPFIGKQTHVGGVAGALPQRGIKYAQIDYATAMTGRMNVLDMTFYTNRTDISALEFSIPLVNEINGVVYSGNSFSAFFSINDGGEYPCGNNDPGDTGTGNPKCFIYNGENTQMGFPTVITMVDISYTSRIKARLLIHNPDVTGAWFSINVKAYAGTPDTQSPFGHDYVGYWKFFNVFETVSGSYYTYTRTNYNFNSYLRTATSKRVWVDQTSWYLYSSSVYGSMSALAAGLGGYAIVEVPIYDYTSFYSDDEFCVTDFSVGDSSSDDMLIVKSKESQYKKAYFIKKWVSSPWTINYFKCKHYRMGLKSYYYYSQSTLEYTSHSYSTNTFTPSSTSQITTTYLQMINNRVLIELNLNTVMNTIMSDGFSWENDIEYALRLYLTFYSYTGWSSASACYVTGGFLNTKGNMPTCSIINYRSVLIRNFQQIVENSRFGYQIIKIELVISPSTSVLANSVGMQAYLYATYDAYSYSRQYIFTATSSNNFARSIQTYTNYNANYCNSAPYSYMTSTAYSYYTGTNLNVDISNFGFNVSSTLQLFFTINPTSALTFTQSTYTTSRPFFVFYIEGFDFTCNGKNRFIATFITSGGTRYSYDATSSAGGRCGSGYVEFQLYNLVTNLGSSTWSSLSTFDTNEYIEFDIELSITAAEEPYRRDWIGLASYLYRYNSKYCCTDSWGAGYPYGCNVSLCCGSYSVYTTSSDLIAIDHETVGSMELANSFTLQALSTNVGLPTELSITLIQIYPEIGKLNQGKILLLEFDTPTHPFTYINGTVNNHQIECQCVTAWNTLFSSTSSTKCILRQPQGTFTNFAITLDIDVSAGQNLRCYFPEWLVQAGSYTATAKLINEESSYPPNIDNVNEYGGLYKTASNTLTFSTTPGVNSLTISQTPSTLYSSTQTVNTVLTTSYSLVMTLNTGSILKPIVYVDFQKSGLIPDGSICSSSVTFQYCRIYNTYRNIIVAKYKSAVSLTQASLTKGSSNLLFPKHKEPGTQYDVLVYMRSQALSQYTYTGSLTRSNANLLPTTVSFSTEPEMSVGTSFETHKSNLILSFKLGGHILFSTHDNGAKIVITEDAGLLTGTKGCTVISVDDPTFFFDCEVSSNQITIKNEYYSRTFSNSGYIQVIVGITNPSTTVTWTIRSYEFYVDASNYGLQIETTATYTPTTPTGTQQSRTQIRMLPFNTKVYSTANSPFRIAFKISDSPPSLPDLLDYTTGYTMILSGLSSLSSFTNFDCFFKQYTSQPTQAQQSPLLNSYRNWKQGTQYIPLYSYCTLINSTALEIEMPRIQGLSIDYYYELVVMPTGQTLTQTGFNNVYDSQFRLLAYPSSCQYIGEWLYYYGHMFELHSLYLVTTRPQVDTALQLHFELTFSSSLTYPDHYLEIVFEDINFDAIKSPYNIIGSSVPCTLSADFTSAGRTYDPFCVVNYVHQPHGDLVLRVVELGNLAASSSYELSLDDFLLPDLSTLLEQSNPFSICIRFHTESTSLHYERCFEELFVIDGYTDTTAQNQLTGTFHDPTLTNYGTSITGKLEIVYPMTSSSSQTDDKAVARISGGYSATSSGLSFGSHTLLWYNEEIDFYVLQQSNNVAGTSLNITLNGAVNPSPSQKQQYQYISTVDITYYDNYHPHTSFNFIQPLYSIFTQNPPLVLLTSAYQTDIRVDIPTSTSSIIKLTVNILQSVAGLTTKLNDLFQVSFDSADVSEVSECWVTTVVTGKQYAGDGSCQTTSDLKVLLHNFYSANVDSNLTLYVKVKHTSQTIDYTTTVYSDNGEIQSHQTYSFTVSAINMGQTPHPLLSFTQNVYTPYYYEQAITPLTISSTAKYLYFSLFLPKDITHEVTIFNIQLPATVAPVNLVQIKLVCEWLQVDRYGRQYHTGVYSHCEYSAPNIIVQPPFGGLPASSGDRIPYLLKVRQLDVIATEFSMPTTSQQEQIIFEFVDSVTEYDTLIFYPYQNFNNLHFEHYTLNTDEYNTYHVEFTPSAAVAPGYEAVLQISLDSRYMLFDLGLQQLFADYGVNSQNSSRIDNNNYNIIHDIIGDSWINGVAYSCYSSTGSQPEQTSIHIGSNIRITHLLQTNFAANTIYIWKIPLLKNPSTADIPFRMNLTLWTYQAGSSLAQKQLFYEIINEHFTITSTPSSISYDFLTQNSIQGTTEQISIEFASSGDVPIVGERVQLKLSNKLTGLINIPDLLLNTETDPSYEFYFFPRINLLICHKTIIDSSTTIETGLNEVTNEYVDYIGFDWLKIHSQSSQTIKKGNSISQLLDHCMINNTALTVSEGVHDSQNSEFLITFQFTNYNCWIAKNSTYEVSYNQNGTFYEGIPNSPCYTSFRSCSCQHTGNGTIEINFDEDIPINTLIKGEFYLRSVGSVGSGTTFTSTIYGLPTLPFTKIIQAPVIADLTISADSFISSTKMEHILIKYIYEDSQMDIRGTVIPNFPFTFINITHPFVASLNSNQRMILRTNSTSPYSYTRDTDLFWVELKDEIISTTEGQHTIPVDGSISYAIQNGSQYTFILESTNDVGILNNYTIGAVGSFYRFEYETQYEIAYEEVYPIAVSQHLTVINPLKEVSAETAVGFKFSVTNHSIVPGNRIHIQLDTYNLKDDMFRKTSEYSIECIQRVKGVLTSEPALVCQTSQYPTTANPNQALIITVYPKNTVPVGTQMQIWLSPVFNPDIEMVAGATVTVDINCNGEKRCVIYESRGYYRATSSLTKTENNVGNFTPSVSTVLQEGVNHVYDIQADVYESIFVKYPENYETIMPLSCGEMSGGDCLIFPSQKKVLAMFSAVNTSSITLTGMVNGIYLQPPSDFQLIAITNTSYHLYSIPHNNLTTRQQIPWTGAATWMTIEPTQTPNIFLRNYMNTVNIKLYGLYSTTFVKAFYINAPVEIATWDDTYCNATKESALHDPYPTRLVCSYINDTTMQILIPEGVEDIYVANVTQEYIITVHAKFQIKDFEPGDGILYVSPPVLSNTFNAYGSYSTDNHLYPFYITEASTTITISEHRVPIVGDINFNTESFIERRANINEKTNFELLIDPKTTEPIKRIEMIIPEEFGYPPVGVHDSCQLITTLTTDLPNCYEIRKNNKTIISIELQEQYDNGPRILKIGSEDENNWFTAPSLPGSWYNMTILLYDENGTLLEAQKTKNSSNIGGLQFYLPNVSVSNGKDASEYQIIDVSFRVQSDVRQGHTTSLSEGDFYTEIKIQFQNLQAFESDLGLGLSEGQLTGCSTKGLTSPAEISCSLQIGNNINDHPAIIVRGYDYFASGSEITISFANVLNLPESVRSTLSVAILLRKVGYSTEAYFYNPAHELIMETTALQATAPTSASVQYNSTLTINLPTTLNFTITPTVDIDDYFVLKFPENGISNKYYLFSPSCSNCQQVDIFHRSNVIRIYPSTTHTANTSVSYTITDFPSPQYVMSSLSWQVQVQAYSSLKKVNSETITIGMDVASCSIDFGLLTMTSKYIYDTGVTYEFEFVIQETFYNQDQEQQRIMIEVTFPTIYGDLRTKGLTCSLNSEATCSFSRVNSIELSGIMQTGMLNHKLTVSGIENPQQTTNTFTISSYGERNMENKMCEGSDTMTLMEAVVRNCTFSIDKQHQSIREKSIYEFRVKCDNVLRNNTQLLIKLPEQYTYNNDALQECWSTSSMNMFSSTCAIIYKEGSYYLQAESIQINNNELYFELGISLANPISSGDYVFEAMLNINDFTYATSNQVTVQILEQTVSSINSLQLINMPTQSGLESIYILRVPTQSLNETLSISFPSQFDLPSSVDVIKHVSNASDWASSLTYSQAIEATGESLNSTISVINAQKQKLLLGNFTNLQEQAGTWSYFLIKSLNNPAFKSNENFTVQSFYGSSLTSPLLTDKATQLLNYTLNEGSFGAHHVETLVSDDDLLYLSDYNLTYRLDEPIQTNQTRFYVYPPSVESLYAITSLSCEVTIQATTYPSTCEISNDIIMIDVADGISIPSEDSFFLSISKLYNPPNQILCTTIQDHKNSYFKLQILKDDRVVTHATKFPSDINDSPCVIFKTERADILPQIPKKLYAGMVHEMSLTLSEPTKMLRVDLNCTDSSISFNQSKVYFSNYDEQTLNIKIFVSSIAVDNSLAYINISHIESVGMDLFRPNLPIPVEIVSDHVEYVEVEELKAQSIGYEIQIPISLTLPSSVDMYLQLNPQTTDSNFVFSSTQILLPAFSSSASFTFKYTGSTIPPTLNISLQLKSKYNLIHQLVKEQIYIYFSTSKTHQTLPPLMMMEVMHKYYSNSKYEGRTIYNIENSQFLLYDELKPTITSYENYIIGSTGAQVLVYTRQQAKIAYVLLEKGKHRKRSFSNAAQLKAYGESIHVQTIKNSSLIVNPYAILNFTHLQQQTKYFLYMMAYSSLGNSPSIVTHTFTTYALSNAATFKLICNEVITNETDIVLKMADILMINPSRIKVVSSQKNVQNSFRNTEYENQPSYYHQIVVSPSSTNDLVPPKELIEQRLINSDFGKERLQQLIPSWKGYFESDPVKILNRVKPSLKSVPKATKISYYNATFTIKYWDQARVHAIILEDSDKTEESLSYAKNRIKGKVVNTSEVNPTTKQISKGLDANNEAAKDHFTALTNKNGKGTIYFGSLKPGAMYTMYVSATSPQIYEPTIYADDNIVTKTTFYTLWNPNLRNKQKLVLEEFKDYNNDMYEAIKEYYDNKEKNNHQIRNQ